MSLKDLRNERGYRQDYVCKKVGITQTYLSLIENKHKIPSIKTLRKLSEFYHLPTNEVVSMVINEGGT